LTAKTLQQIRDELRVAREELAVQIRRMELVEATRGLQAAIEARARDDARLEDHERRISRLEAAAG
jgi:hypothetical protein